MTGGEELVGNVNRRTVVLTILLFLFLSMSLITGCNQSDNEIKTISDSNSKALFVADVYEKCGDILFAALYHLSSKEQFFKNREDLMGQPAYFFSDLLTQETKETILIQLTQLYAQSDGSDELVTLNRSLNQWCEAHHTTQSLQHKYSYEEFLAGLFRSERFEYLFFNHSNSPIFQSDEFSAFEKVTSLSSAQGQHIISTLITDLSTQPAHRFELDIKALKALY